jgi:hypothetical protein
MFVSGFGPTPAGCEHHYNFAQKIFQVGEHSTIGITTWGLGNLHQVSYRTLIARFADSLAGQSPTSMTDVANRWSQMFWTAYNAELSQFLQRVHVLIGQATRSPAEENELLYLVQSFAGGFCIGGYLANDRTPSAFEVLYSPTQTQPAQPIPLAIGTTRFWGCPNLIERLIYGLDQQVMAAIIQSGKWSGTQQELIDLLMPYCLGQPFDLPIREAIDWVHASIYTTIKTMKFSHMAPVCGGPVELAVITTDRRFRWVRHKGLGSAIGDGVLSDGNTNHVAR